MTVPRYQSRIGNQRVFRTALRFFYFIAFFGAAICVLGTFLVAHFEKLPLFDAFYLIVITLATVGYGDIHPVTQIGKIVIMLLIVFGVGFVSLSASIMVATLVEGHIINYWRERKMEKKITKLKNHIIVCGLGRAGTAAIKQLERERTDFVGIDLNERHVEALKERNYMVINGDATEDDILKLAGIKLARSIISALPSDSANILITMAAKDLNPSIRVVARADHPENITRLKRAGADWVTAVGVPGGSRLALAALKPTTVDFVHSVLERRHAAYKLEELLIEEGSFLSGKQIKESRLKEEYGAQLLAIVRDDVTMANPGADEQILAGDVIIVFGEADRLAMLESSPGTACALLSSEITEQQP
ncbi:MAG: potassium channel protein [Bacillota bacterium]